MTQIPRLGSKPLEPSSSLSPRPRFGGYGAPLFTQIFSCLERNPIQETLAKDVLGFNVPRIATARTWRERMDTAICELANSGITVSGTLLLPPLVRWFVKAFTKVDNKVLLGETVASTIAPKAMFARLAVSFGFMFPFAAAFWAAPFFRNWMTMKKLKTADFDDLIGLGGPAKSKKPKKSLEESMREQIRQITKILLIGLSLGAASVLGFGALARSGSIKTVSQPFRKFFELFELKGKNADQVADGLATLLFWSMPAYLGWIQGARSSNERKEWALKFANSAIWFTLMPHIVKSWFTKPFNAELVKAGHPIVDKVMGYKQILKLDDKVKTPLLAMKNKMYLFQLAFSIIMLGTTPQLLNIYLTNKRHCQAMESLKASTGGNEELMQEILTEASHTAASLKANTSGNKRNDADYKQFTPQSYVSSCPNTAYWGTPYPYTPYAYGGYVPPPGYYTSAQR